jgi:hypothetical protein
MPSSVVTPPNTLTNEESSKIIRTLGWVDSACRGIGLINITKDIDRAKRDTKGLFPDRQKIRFHIEHITERVVDDLAEQLFCTYHLIKQNTTEKPIYSARKSALNFQKRERI